jgi:hypothetical protein
MTNIDIIIITISYHHLVHHHQHHHYYRHREQPINEKYSRTEGYKEHIPLLSLLLSNHVLATEFLPVTLLMLTNPFSADGAFADAPAAIVAFPAVPGYF